MDHFLEHPDHQLNRGLGYGYITYVARLYLRRCIEKKFFKMTLREPSLVGITSLVNKLRRVAGTEKLYKILHIADDSHESMARQERLVEVLAYLFC